MRGCGNLLEKFSVTNYKNFKDELSLNLGQVKDYNFGLQAIRNKNIKTAMIYGENGSGKTNLGKALTDIVNQLTDRRKEYNVSIPNDLEVDGIHVTQFSYEFNIYGQKINYRYDRIPSGELLEEVLLINDRLSIYYNHITHESINNLLCSQNINMNLYGKKISIVKYLLKNIDSNSGWENILLKAFTLFIEGIYLFEIPEILSSTQKDHQTKWAKKIIQQSRLKDFENFLHRAGIKVSLIESELDGEPIISLRLKEREINFFSIASSSTVVLSALYSILSDMDSYSLIYIDGFDTFLHPDVARLVLLEVLSSDTQTVLTAHNTSLIDNQILRPDCYFNLRSGNLDAFSELTLKDLRQSHLLEKLYKGGHFD
jgi:Cdc6-like AAA superfamily ATPase